MNERRKITFGVINVKIGRKILFEGNIRSSRKIETTTITRKRKPRKIKKTNRNYNYSNNDSCELKLILNLLKNQLLQEKEQQQ